jgi:hypothetical protein
MKDQLLKNLLHNQIKTRQGLGDIYLKKLLKHVEERFGLKNQYIMNIIMHFITIKRYKKSILYSDSESRFQVSIKKIKNRLQNRDEKYAKH